MHWRIIFYSTLVFTFALNSAAADFVPKPSLLITEAAVMGSEMPEPPLPSPPPDHPIIFSNL